MGVPSTELGGGPRAAGGVVGLVDWSSAASVAGGSAAMLAVIIVVVRVIGNRSFSKMSSFDFAVTVSIGSILGSVATSSTTLRNGALGVGTLLLVQAAIAWVRARRSAVERVVDNTPVLLMDGPQMLHDNLRAVRMTPDDVRGKLREANVLRLDHVRAVVLETTGDVSVIHGEGDVDREILDGVDPGPERSGSTFR